MNGFDFRYRRDWNFTRCPHVGGYRPDQCGHCVFFCVLAKPRLQPGLDSAEQPEPHLVVIARERDHETHPAMAGGVGIARERADPVHGASLVHAAVVAVEQAGVGRKEPQHFGEAAGGETVVAADARALLEMDCCGEAMRGEHLVHDLKLLLEADRRAQAVPANLQEDLVRDVVVRGAEHLSEDLRKGARLSVNVD
jgi:hypothetical protein